MHKLVPLILLTLAFPACGTGVFRHKIELTFDDPSKRLPDPTEVSIFNHQSGTSEEWVRRWIGTTQPGKPYTGETSNTDVKMIYDRTPSAEVSAGIYLPALQKDGYFIFEVRPAGRTDEQTTMKYESFYVPTKEDDKILPLAAHFRGEPSSKGWTIRLKVDVPPADTKKP
jgi:hypothetical protein